MPGLETSAKDERPPIGTWITKPAGSTLVSVADMFGNLLRCFMFYNASVQLDEHYKGEECDMRLSFTELYRGLKNTYGDGPILQLHYLWGSNFYTHSVIYCARVTSGKKFFGTVSYNLTIPKDEKNTIVGAQVIDRKAPPSRGYVDFYEGDDGKTLSVLMFESKKGKSMDYVVTLFGIPHNECCL